MVLECRACKEKRTVKWLLETADEDLLRIGEVFMAEKERSRQRIEELKKQRIAQLETKLEEMEKKVDGILMNNTCV